MSFIIPGLSTYFVPRFVASLVFGAGAITSAASAMSSTNVGMKTSTGSMTADTDVAQYFSVTDVDAQVGAGSECAQMDYVTLAQGEGAFFHACPLEPGGGTAATATIVLGASVTATGQWSVVIGGIVTSGGIALADTNDTVGAAIAAAITANPRLAVSASYNAGTHTLTISVKNKGIQGNDWILFFDPSAFTTTGLTATVTGSATAGSAYRIRMGVVAGAGLPNVTNILAKLQGTTYQRIAAGQYDTGTNAPLWVSYVDAKAAPFVQRYEQVTMGFNGSYANAATLAQTTINDVRITVAWARNSEWHPAQFAAAISAIRALNEGSDPLTDYDGWVITGMPAQRYNSDIPLDSESNTAITNGITPITTINGNQSAIVRGVTSHSLSSSLADHRTMDWGDVTVVDAFANAMSALWTTSYKPHNSVVEDNGDPEELHLESGIAYPAGWDAETRGLMDKFRSGAFFGLNKALIAPFQDADATSYLDPVADRIMQQIAITPNRLNHGVGVQVNDTKSA